MSAHASIFYNVFIWISLDSMIESGRTTGFWCGVPGYQHRAPMSSDLPAFLTKFGVVLTAMFWMLTYCQVLTSHSIHIGAKSRPQSNSPTLTRSQRKDDLLAGLVMLLAFLFRDSDAAIGVQMGSVLLMAWLFQRTRARLDLLHADK